MEFDGTTYGITEIQPCSVQIVNQASQHADETTTSYWGLDGLWPVFHVITDSVIQGGAYIVHFTVDLLREFVLRAVQFFESPAFQEFVEFLVDKVFYFIFYDFIRTTAVLYTMLDYAVYFNPTSPITWGLAVAAAGMTFLSLLAPTNYIESAVNDGLYSHGYAAGCYLLLAAMCFTMAIGWKNFKGFLAVGTAYALGILFGAHKAVGGVMSLWIEDLLTATWFSRFYLAFMIGWFLGAMAVHLAQ